jgi:hypothetical protein
MEKKFYSLWILMVIIFRYGQTQFTEDSSLGMDQAYLTISNKNYSEPIIFKYNLIVCEKCDFEILNDPFPMNTSRTFVINTKYAYDFQLHTTNRNDTLQCRIRSHKFPEHGSYLFEVIETEQNQDSCSIIQTEKSSYYWLPVIIGVSIILAFILFIQVWHHISHSQRFARFASNAAQNGLINDDFVISLPRNTNSISYDTNDDIIKTLTTGSELPLVGSTRLSNNSIRIKTVLPKRLRSLDTFRGFSLMVMILVNYGGKLLRIFFRFLLIIKVVVIGFLNIPVRFYVKDLID